MDGPRRILVTGASGLVGRFLVARLLQQGRKVVATSRDPERHKWPRGVEAVAWEGRQPIDLRGVDGVVHLAGASIGGRRWNRAYKEEMRRSRVESGHALTASIASCPEGHRPVLVSAGAIGFYGMDPDGECREDRDPGDDFLARLCVDWEAAVRQAPTRVVRFRFGHVLDANDGILARLLPLYRARIAGPIASGRQGLPWVHVEDVARAISWALDTPSAQGAYNLAAPEAVDQRTFNDTLARVLGVPARIPLPGFALRVAVGQLGPYLVGGQRTPPARLLDEGFRFEHPGLEGALKDLLGGAAA